MLQLKVRIVLAFVVLAALAAPIGVAAQSRPSYATADEDTVRGRIVSIAGLDISVRDEHGYVDRVRLHPGTIINPTGLRLSPGMSVTIRGYNEGQVLGANEIDTPYEYGPAPVFYGPYAPRYYGTYGYGYDRYPYGSAYGYGYGYGYDRYPYGSAYGYGYGYPAVAIGVRVGGYPRYDGRPHRGGYGYFRR